MAAKKKAKAKAKTASKANAKGKTKAKAKAKTKTPKGPSNMSKLRALFKGKKKGQTVKLDSMFKVTGWDGHVLHSAMAVARDAARTKNPDNLIKAEYIREDRVYKVL